MKPSADNSFTPGEILRNVVAAAAPLQVMGTINAYTAMMAEKSGAKESHLLIRCRCCKRILWVA